ncbi:hypothetical protein FVQ98_17695 [Ottowia sp. GY511]|uniref:Uncharacterized protein n=1 Tax=Ottowia flava TaxID=2675430 RepID=A0ABW4KUY2_9BURK|nr:hypothetical protein [Ottowia sp. GY511]TXK23290.1 hypothetical protein FVQ98_17695 [Ottowia sp. GY511]
MSSPAPTLVPKTEPDWSGAAEVLIEGCAHLPTPEERVRWLERLCISLGDALYPAFLQVLCRVGEHGDAAAQKAVADTLVLALQTGRLPSGRHTAWGATHGTATRAMGPVEYLCAWHAQPDNRGPLAATAFDRAARAVLGLVSHSDQARRMYCAKLLADAEDPLGGAWARGTRPALAAMARSWGAVSATTSPQRAAADAVDAFLAELRRSGGEGVAQVTSGWIPPAPLR